MLEVEVEESVEKLELILSFELVEGLGLIGVGASPLNRSLVKPGKCLSIESGAIPAALL